MSTPPAVLVLMVTEHCPVPPLVRQVLIPPTKVAPATLFKRLKVTRVPLGAGPNPVAGSPGGPAGSASSCCTVAVIVCGSVTLLVAVNGPRSICASGMLLTNVHVTVSPGATSMAPTGEPSEQVALVCAQPATAPSETE